MNEKPAGLTRALHHREVVFSPQDQRRRLPDGIAAENHRRAHVDFLVRQVVQYPSRLQTCSHNPFQNLKKVAHIHMLI